MGKERFLKAKDDFYNPLQIIRFIWQVLSEGNDIALSFGQPMDVLGNPVDIDGNSYDKYGNLIQVQDYFVSGGKVTENLQRESEYTKDLAEKIVERYLADNIVVSSHLGAFGLGIYAWRLSKSPYFEKERFTRTSKLVGWNSASNAYLVFALSYSKKT